MVLFWFCFCFSWGFVSLFAFVVFSFVCVLVFYCLFFLCSTFHVPTHAAKPLQLIDMKQKRNQLRMFVVTRKGMYVALSLTISKLYPNS